MDMEERYSRTARLFGEDAVKKLNKSRVLVFGLGGVGGHAVEALARAGVGELELVDGDRVCASNLNRQLFATEETVGLLKTQAAAQRIRAVNSCCRVVERPLFFLPERAAEFDFARYDYVIDAIDTVSGKLGIVAGAYAAGTPVISAMGAGNKVDPTRFEVADIFSTSVCPLARVMRRELKKLGVSRLKVVYSREEPRVPQGTEDVRTPASNSFVPAVAGLILAGEVIKDLIGFTL